MISQADNNKKQNWFIPLGSKKVLILIFVKMCQGDYCQEFSATIWIRNYLNPKMIENKIVCELYKIKHNDLILRKPNC